MKNQRIIGLYNFAMNIKDLMKKLQNNHGPMTLTSAEMNQIVQYYLESIDVMKELETKEL